jgi:hypothetical protein
VPHQGFIVLGLSSSIFARGVCELLQELSRSTLELPDQKAQGFLVLIVFNRLFPEHVHKVFGKMPVRT